MTSTYVHSELLSISDQEQASAMAAYHSNSLHSLTFNVLVHMCVLLRVLSSFLLDEWLFIFHNYILTSSVKPLLSPLGGIGPSAHSTGEPRYHVIL